MTPFHHAMSSAQKYGGHPDDYIEIHNWFDETKAYTGDWTHRALRHHSAGIEEAVIRFHHYIINEKHKQIPVKLIAEQHVKEDCGFIPTPKDWLDTLEKHPKEWMLRVSKMNKQLNVPFVEPSKNKKNE